MRGWVLDRATRHPAHPTSEPNARDTSRMLGASSAVYSGLARKAERHVSDNFPQPIGDIVPGGVLDASFDERYQAERLRLSERNLPENIAHQMATKLVETAMLDEIHLMLRHLCRKAGA